MTHAIAVLWNVAEVSIVLSPILIALISIGRRQQKTTKQFYEELLETFRIHEEFDKQSDAEILRRIDALSHSKKKV